MTPHPAPSAPARTLEDQWQEFARCRFLAMPIAGTVAWTVIGLASLFLEVLHTNLVIFGATGSIFYLALIIAKFTGEDLLGKTRRGNLFDRLFLLSVVMAVMVYAIAIPFFLIEPTSLPLSVGILTGLMWISFSGLLRHWVGFFHGFTRTVLIVVVWYLFPEYRYLAISAVIVAVYLVTIVVLARRDRSAWG